MGGAYGMFRTQQRGQEIISGRKNTWEDIQLILVQEEDDNEKKGYDYCDDGSHAYGCL